MARICYEVTATIHTTAFIEDWMRWMLAEHIGDVCKAGATSGRLVRLDDPPNAFIVQYEFPSRQAFDHYLAVHAERLRQQTAAHFDPDQISYSRRVGEWVESA